MWSFETEPEFQNELKWIRTFVDEEVEPLDLILGSQWNIHDPRFMKLVRPLQAQVKARRLWACHLGPELGGKGYGQLKLALMNEQFGRSRFGPIVFWGAGSRYGKFGNSGALRIARAKAALSQTVAGQRYRVLFAMTEPQGGADPLVLEMSAIEDGDDWVLNGEKWFASNARFASFFIVMAVTDKAAENPYRSMSMFILPAEIPGIEFVRDTYFGQAEAEHAHMLGACGDAFAVAQVRLGGGRLHHAMRALAEANKCLDLTCLRVVSRHTKGQRLGDMQMVQEKLADCWIQLRQFRLLTLETAWLADQAKDWKAKFVTRSYCLRSARVQSYFLVQPIQFDYRCLTFRMYWTSLLDIHAMPLRAFLKVAELRSFTRASQTMHISQPALSATIRELERRLGCSVRRWRIP
jgi:acyl-CoA dehydrogenase